jgi:hypothetical protein
VYSPKFLLSIPREMQFWFSTMNILSVRQSKTLLLTCERTFWCYQEDYAVNGNLITKRHKLLVFQIDFDEIYVTSVNVVAVGLLDMTINEPNRRKQYADYPLED